MGTASSDGSTCVIGPVFLDVVMSGLDGPPRPGEEQWVSGCAITAGGAANQAIAIARLLQASGADDSSRPRLVTTIGQDRAGHLVADILTSEGIDLRWASRCDRQNVTTSLAFNGDRAMVTYGSESVSLLADVIQGDHPAALVADMNAINANHDSIAQWGDVWVLGDVGWDPSEQWDIDNLRGLDVTDVFTPNETEAMRYTRTDNVEEAARALSKKVPLVVVTCGPRGAVACDGTELFTVPALDIPVVDPTGAGDVFSAGLTFAHHAGLQPRAAVSLAIAASNYTVRFPGGSSSAPTGSDLHHWVASLSRDLTKGLDLTFLDVLNV